jgi:diamine N-acetyltransferase
MSGLSVRFRAVAEEDAASLARFAEDAFRETFGHANTDRDMNIHCANSFGAAHQLAEISDSKVSTVLVEFGTTLVGFGQLRVGAAPACVQGSRPWEIYRLYVDSSWHGRGIAQRLMTMLIDQAFESGADSVWLGVWERNPRAIAFYEKSGFRSVGEHTFMLGTDKQRDLVMQYQGKAR